MTESKLKQSAGQAYEFSSHLIVVPLDSAIKALETERKHQVSLRKLLAEYRDYAFRERENWDLREGDEADHKSRAWQAKIDQITKLLNAA